MEGPEMNEIFIWAFGFLKGFGITVLITACVLALFLAVINGLGTVYKK